MIRYLPVLILMSLMASFGSYFLKRSTANGLLPKQLLSTPWLYIGGTLYVVSGLLSYWMLKILPYSVVVPLGAFTYIWTLLLSRFLLGEEISKRKIVGIGIIMSGVVTVALS